MVFMQPFFNLNHLNNFLTETNYYILYVATWKYIAYLNHVTIKLFL